MAKRGRAVRLIAGGMIVAGAGLLVYTGYKVWDPYAGARQHAAQTALTRSWGELPALSAPPVAAKSKCTAPALCVGPNQDIPVGQVFAFIQIPAFGPAWKFTIIQGTTLAQLATGPGHILGTALPGQAGDVGIGGPDLTGGSPLPHPPPP